MNVFLIVGKQTMAFVLEIIYFINQKWYHYALTSLNGHVAAVLHEVTSLWTPSHTRQASWGVWNKFKKSKTFNELLSLFVIFCVKKSRKFSHVDC